MQIIDTNNIQALVPYQSNEPTSFHPFEDLLVDIRNKHLFSLLSIKDLLLLGKTNKKFRQIIPLFDISKSLNFFSIESVHDIAIDMLFETYITPNYLHLLIDHLFISKKDKQSFSKTMEYFLLSINQITNSQIDQLIKGILDHKKELIFDLAPKLKQGFVKILERRALQGSEIAINALLRAYKFEDYGLKSRFSNGLASAKDFADKGSEKAIAFLIQYGIEYIADKSFRMENIKLIKEYAEKKSENAIDFIIKKLCKEYQEQQLNYSKYQADQGSENAIEFLLDFYFKKDSEKALELTKIYAELGSETAIRLFLVNRYNNFTKEAYLECAKGYADKGSEEAIYSYLYQKEDLEKEELLALVKTYADLGSKKALTFLITFFQLEKHNHSKEDQNKILDFIKSYAYKGSETAIQAILNPNIFKNISSEKRLKMCKKYAKQGSFQALLTLFK